MLKWDTFSLWLRRKRKLFLVMDNAEYKSWEVIQRASQADKQRKRDKDRDYLFTTLFTEFESDRKAMEIREE